MRCPGSISLSEGIENVSSAFAEEGSRLHALSEDMLRGQTRLFDTEEFTDEQLSVAQAYVDVVQREHEELGGTLLVEQRFKLPHHPEFFGTADAVIVSPPHLRVLDLKAGRGVAVEVDYGGKINPQLGFYALGALTVAGNPEQFTDIEVVVVQPRLGGVKRRKVTLVELQELAEELVHAARLASQPAAPTAAGSWCKFCLARATCPTLKSHVNTLAKDDFDDLKDPADMTGTMIAEVLNEADVIETWLKAVREKAHKQLEDGVVVPGWKLEAKRAQRKWRDERIVKQRLASEGLDGFLDEKLVTPAQAERLAKKQGVTIDLADLTVSESSGFNLSRDVQKGSATSTASDDFAE